jgi:hypothetical protein
LGIWGPGSFDSEEAADWVHVFRTDGMAAISDAFSAVNGATDRLDSASATAALAAAEVLAVALGSPSARQVPAIVDGILKGEQFQSDEALVASAQQAIARVKSDSHLADRWNAVGEPNEWLSNVTELQRRLSGWSPTQVWRGSGKSVVTAEPADRTLATTKQGYGGPAPGSDDFDRRKHAWVDGVWWTSDRLFWWDGSRWQPSPALDEQQRLLRGTAPPQPEPHFAEPAVPSLALRQRADGYKFCPTCGAPIRAEDRFCGACGTSIDSGARANVLPRLSRRGRWRLPALMVIAVLILGALGASAVVYGPSILNPPPPEDVMLAHAQESVVTINVIGDHFKASGSGFFVDDADHILTNYHVIRDAWKVTVTTRGGATVVADLVSYDANNDVAELMIALSGPKLSLRREPPVAGEVVYVLGNPGGESPNSTSKGVVTRLHVTQTVAGTTYTNFDMTDALVRPGNSGGPVVDRYGRVLGLASVGSVITGEGGFILDETFSSELPTWSQVSTVTPFAAPPPSIALSAFGFDGVCSYAYGCAMHVTAQNLGGPGQAVITFTIYASNKTTVLASCSKQVALDKGDSLPVGCVANSAALMNYFCCSYRTIWGSATVSSQTPSQL